MLTFLFTMVSLNTSRAGPFRRVPPSKNFNILNPTIDTFPLDGSMQKKVSRVYGLYYAFRSVSLLPLTLLFLVRFFFGSPEYLMLILTPPPSTSSTTSWFLKLCSISIPLT